MTNEVELFVAEKIGLAAARERRLMKKSPRKHHAPKGDNRVVFDELDDLPVEIEADDTSFDWRIALKEANGE